jgi:hypothetical protein
MATNMADIGVLEQAIKLQQSGEGIKSNLSKAIPETVSP